MGGWCLFIKCYAMLLDLFFSLAALWPLGQWREQFHSLVHGSPPGWVPTTLCSGASCSSVLLNGIRPAGLNDIQ